MVSSWALLSRSSHTREAVLFSHILCGRKNFSYLFDKEIEWEGEREIKGEREEGREGEREKEGRRNEREKRRKSFSGKVT